MTRGIYAGPDINRANRDREVNGVHPEDWMDKVDSPKKACVEVKKRLWAVDFDVKNVSKGCAVIKADNPDAAVQILKTEGIYNGTPHVYKVTRVEEIIPSPEEMLISEQVVMDSSHLN